MIADGLGYRAPTLLGAGLALAGLAVFTLGRSFERRGEVREQERRADEAEAVIADLLADVRVS